MTDATPPADPSPAAPVPPDPFPGAFSLDRWLESIYGVLFLPQATFAALRDRPAPVEAGAIVVLANLLEGLRLGDGAAYVLLGALLGVAGWIALCYVLVRLAAAFDREVALPVLLTLTGYASVPWLTIGPALSLPDELGTLAAIAVGIWFVVWQVRAAAAAFGVGALRVLSLIPLAMFGGYIAIVWLVNVVKLAFSVAR